MFGRATITFGIGPRSSQGLILQMRWQIYHLLVPNFSGFHVQKPRICAAGPMPNVMAALPNIGGALCSTPQSLADAHCWSTVQ